MRPAWIAACLVAWSATAAETPPPPPDPEFLEFLAEMGAEDEQFADYIESRKGGKQLERAEQEASKDEGHE
ncbi:MAG TPA: hypothetical protein VH856_07480 [Steroidobacteraceae bacterium]